MRGSAPAPFSPEVERAAREFDTRVEQAVRRACAAIENWHVILQRPAGAPVPAAVYTQSALVQRLVAGELSRHGLHVVLAPSPGDTQPLH